MSDARLTPIGVLNFIGKPEEIGAQIYERLCAPALFASMQKMPLEARAELHAALLYSMLGGMAGDLGRDNAVLLAREAVMTFVTHTKGLR